MKRSAALVAGPVAAALLMTWLGGAPVAGASPTADTPATADAQTAGAQPVSATLATKEEVRRLISSGDYAAAETIARALVRDAEAAHGSDAVEVAGPLDMLVETMWKGDKAADPETRQLAERALAIREHAGDTDGNGVAQTLSNLCVLLRGAGDLEAARPHCERALAIREKVLGPDHPDVARALNNLANVVGDLGDLRGCRDLYARALAIREQALGPDHPEVGSTYNNLAITDAMLGDYPAALPEMERALAIREKVLGPDHPDVGVALQNLGNITRFMGDYPRTRSLYERSLAIAEKRTGPESLATAAVVSDLGLLLGTMGDPVAAEAAHRRALAIWEKVLPPDHPQIAFGIDNLADLMLANGDAVGARPLFERALPVLEAALGPESADVALNVHSQAMARAQMGDRPGARQTFERAAAIQEKALGPSHPDLATTLGNLGALLKDMGEYAAARTNLERALTIRESALGSGHPDTTATRDMLARLAWMQGRFDEAMSGALQAEKDARAQFVRAARLLSQREALRYETVRSSGLDTALTALLSPKAEARDPAAAKRQAPRSREEHGRAAAGAWDEEVRARAMVLDEMASRHRALAGRDEPALKPPIQALDAAREALARLAVRGPASGHPQAFAREVQEAQAREDSAERVLATKSDAFRQDRDRRQAGLPEVVAALPKGSALVAYVRYKRLVETGGAPAVPSYMAFVARAGDRGRAEAVALAQAQEIDALVQRWHDEVAIDPRGAAAGFAAGNEGGAKLRAAIWDPVAGHVRGATTVFVVPDGAIDLVNLATLPGRDGRYLLESGPTLHLLSAERDLVRPPLPHAPATAVVALGGVDFDARIDARAPPTRTATVFRGSPASCSTFRALRFDPLPGALAEAREVGSMWKERKADVRLLTGSDADEAAFKRLAPGSRILHLATHGYFVQDDCEGGDNPLVLSGLALAGANRRDQQRDPAETEDGILTGEEVAALDLSGVEWAVLSACETGIGRVQPSEGVLGLRRAFEIAGARTLVMSLWKVEDGATRLFMRELYDARAAGLSTAESIRRAATRILALQRKQGLPDDPYFWGAFVAAGDWR